MTAILSRPQWVNTNLHTDMDMYYIHILTRVPWQSSLWPPPLASLCNQSPCGAEHGADQQDKSQTIEYMPRNGAML